jgi:hypothetical protein
MKKLMVMFVALTLLMSFGMVSAKTLVAGKIYNADFTDVVVGADVTITCENSSLGTFVTYNVTSSSEGSYAVEFYEGGGGTELCNDGDTLTVDANKDGMFGSESGVILNDFLYSWDVAIVNVPLVPEFGVIVGMLTVLSAVGIFFVVRRE